MGEGSDSCPACAEPTAESFSNPKGTVHIITGNGGPPGKDSFTTAIPASRKQSLEYGYGRLVAHNATTIEFWQFENAGGSAKKTASVIAEISFWLIFVFQWILILTGT